MCFAELQLCCFKQLVLYHCEKQQKWRRRGVFSSVFNFSQLTWCLRWTVGRFCSCFVLFLFVKTCIMSSSVVSAEWWTLLSKVVSLRLSSQTNLFTSRCVMYDGFVVCNEYLSGEGALKTGGTTGRLTQLHVPEPRSCGHEVPFILCFFFFRLYWVFCQNLITESVPQGYFVCTDPVLGAGDNIRTVFIFWC